DGSFNWACRLTSAVLLCPVAVVWLFPLIKDRPLRHCRLVPLRTASRATRRRTRALAARRLDRVTAPALQQPPWPDLDSLTALKRELEGLPPLVLPAECDQLKERLASVARGEAFLLQGGDCAETFAGATADSVRGKFQTLLQMAVILT